MSPAYLSTLSLATFLHLFWVPTAVFSNTPHFNILLSLSQSYYFWTNRDSAELLSSSLWAQGLPCSEHWPCDWVLVNGIQKCWCTTFRPGLLEHYAHSPSCSFPPVVTLEAASWSWHSPKMQEAWLIYLHLEESLPPNLALVFGFKWVKNKHLFQWYTRSGDSSFVAATLKGKVIYIYI